MCWCLLEVPEDGPDLTDSGGFPRECAGGVANGRGHVHSCRQSTQSDKMLHSKTLGNYAMSLTKMLSVQIPSNIFYLLSWVNEVIILFVQNSSKTRHLIWELHKMSAHIGKEKNKQHKRHFCLISYLMVLFSFQVEPLWGLFISSYQF